MAWLALLAAGLPAVASAAPPPNDDKANATIVPALPFQDYVFTQEATTAPTDPILPCGSGGRGATVWYRFTPAINTSICVRACGSDYDTVAAIGIDSAGGAFISLGCNDDFCDLQSRTSASVTAGVPTFIHLASYSNGPGGTLRVRIAQQGVDSDGDGVDDCDDNCGDRLNPGQDDDDDDGVGDVCESCPTCAYPFTDTDGDGRCNACDVCPDDATDQCDTLLGCTGAGNTSSSLYRISPESGTFAQVGQMSINQCGGLAFDPGGTLYAVGRTLASVEALFRVNINTGAATLVAPIVTPDRFSDISFRPDGTLFALFPSQKTLGTVDLGTGSFSTIGPTLASGGGGNGIAFAPGLSSSKLFHADEQSLNILSQITGEATEVAALTFPVSCDSARVTALEFKDAGTLYAVLNCSGPTLLATVDTTTGVVTTIGPSVAGLEGIAGHTLCGNGTLDPGEQCDDGNKASGDCCSASCHYDTSGRVCGSDGDPCTADVCDGAGQCNHPFSTGPCTSDGNTCTDDVCDGAGHCNHLINTAPCDDGNICTTADTCASGTCISGPPLPCANGCLSCLPATGCMPVISTGCHEPIVSGKSAVRLKNSSNDLFDTVRWKWLTGDATDPASLGNPTTGPGEYTLCVYDETAGVPSVALHAAAPFGGTCGSGKACWKQTGNGYRYNDSIGTPDGLLRLSIRAGAAGQSRVMVRGRGPALGMPALPLHQDTKAVVQLKKRGGGACFDAVYGTSTRNTAGQFSAKAD